jgi:SagB-type dehydrogenase family enzyme
VPPTLFLALRGQLIVSEAGGEVVLQTAASRLTFRRLGPDLRAALLRLAAGEEEARLRERVLQDGGVDAAARLTYYLERLDRRGLLLRSVRGDDGPLMTLVPAAPGFEFAPPPLAPERRYVLCRFSYARREGRQLVLESPLAHGRVRLHGPRAAAVLLALARPGTPAELSGRAPDLSSAALTLLLGAGMVREAVDEAPALREWAFHDLAFHASSRMGRHDRPVGGTFPFAGELPPPPALPPVRARSWLDLERPDANRPERQDPPLAQVLEAQGAVRAYGAHSIDRRQLGEFLYRTARVRFRRHVEVETPRGPVVVEFAPRPYPNGGSLYELELYAVTERCAGTPPGLYYYDPLGHRLGLVAERTEVVERLLVDAARSAGVPSSRLQVLLFVSARFPRRAWKYASTAYANTLKNVGALYQTMHLVATAMGQASCAVPDVDTERFAAATGIDAFAEGPVGAFLIGSRPAVPGAGDGPAGVASTGQQGT